MYTEKSAELKDDFYVRFGETGSELFFERIGVPCVIMDSATNALAFAMGCGVRAYGRKSGDVLRILNSDSDVSDVHFMPGGRGAQIIYRMDAPGMPGMNETAGYAVECILRRMGLAKSSDPLYSLPAICDKYGSRGWCAYTGNDKTESIPLPLTGYNVVFLRTMRNRKKKADSELAERFRLGEDKRITAAAEGLKKCRIDVFFDMVNESELASEYIFSYDEKLPAAVRKALDTDGVAAAKICDGGIVLFTESDKTDHVIRIMSLFYEKQTGFPSEIIVAL